jgi:hypothetical protein
VAVKRAQSDPTGAPLDARGISKFGLVLSRFEFNKMPNPSYKPGVITSSPSTLERVPLNPRKGSSLGPIGFRAVPGTVIAMPHL